MASVFTSYAPEDPFDPRRRPPMTPALQRPPTADQLAPDSGAVGAGLPPLAVTMPEPVAAPPVSVPVPDEEPAKASPRFFGDAADPNKKNVDIYNDPQFADFMAEQKPDKTGRVLDALFSGLAGKSYDSGFWEQKDQAAQQEELKNPGSAQSQMMRQAHAPMLKQLGLADDEIAHLSGADIQQMTKGGDLVQGLMRGRQAAQQAKAAQAEKLREEQVRHDEADLSAKRAHENALDQARFTGNTPEEKERIAALQGGIVGQREANQAVLGNSLAMNREVALANLADQRRRDAEARAEERRIADENRRHAYDEAHPKAGQGEPLKVEDIEGTGWAVDDPTSAARIINKRALTKAVIPQMADARTAIESLDKLIANREKYGSDPARWNPKVTEDNDLYMATVKQNYKNAMGMPNTDSSEKELAHLFPDPNAVTGKGVGGIVKGIGATVGVADDPVLAELKAARAEAIHNLTSKIPIPSVKYIGSGKYKGNAAAGEHGGAAQAPAKVHVRFKDGSERDLSPEMAQRAREAGDAL